MYHTRRESKSSGDEATQSTSKVNHTITNTDAQSTHITSINKAEVNHTSTLIKDTDIQERVRKYDSFTRAPFDVMIKIPYKDKSSQKKLSLLGISKKLLQANIKFDKVEKYAFNTWKITFNSKTLANSALSNIYLKEMGVNAFIPKYKFSRKIVIKDIPVEMSIEELKTAIKDENSKVLIVNAFRLKRKDRETKKRIDSPSVCLEIRGEVIPDFLIILRTVNPVSPYIPFVRICFKYGRYGHISRMCERTPKCLICAGDHTSSTETSWIKGHRCINCDGDHNTLNRECPTLKKQKEIVKIMACDNVPFLVAKRLVEKNQADMVEIWSKQ